MMLKPFLKGHNLCITPNAYKMKLLKELSNEPNFYHIQFITLSELKKQLFYEYKKDALYHLCKQFQLIPENGAVLLEAMYDVTEDIDHNLNHYKEWLKNNHLIIEHPAFLEQLKRSNVIVYGYEEYEIKPFLRIIKSYANVTYVTEEEKHYTPTVTKYETLEQEVVGTAEKITTLLSNGISIEHIYLCTSSEDYNSVIAKIFHQFQIPFQKKETHTLYEYPIIQEFLKSIPDEEPLKNLPDILETLEKKYPKENPFYHTIYETLISIINSYYKESRTFLEIKEFLIYELKKARIKKETYQNVLKEVDFQETLFEENDYVFILGANLGEFPQIYEDNDYFSDSQKEILGLPTSFEKTNGEEQKIIRKITSLAHVLISYKKKSPFKEYIKSSFLEAFPQEQGEYHYTNASYNTYLLNSSLDLFVNFNQKNKDLISRYGIESVYYSTYDNQFTGISGKTFTKYVPYVVLSYTSMQKFFECPFKYYIGSILKITPPFEETISLKIGNLFHSILEQYFKREKPLDEIIEQEMSKLEMSPIQKQEFYVQKYKTEIKRLIQLIEQQQSHSELNAAYFEKTIEWVEQRRITFKLFGKIDKIMTIDDGEHSYVIVIDYKTGFSTSDLSKVIYGMNMQLLLYLYFITKDENLKKYKLGGAYIQSISPTVLNYTEGKTLEDLLWEQGKLDGISLKRHEFVSRLDTHYQIASYIKGIRVKSDGDFYASNRLLEPDIVNQLLEIVKNNIEEVEQAIENADFKISPKKFSSETKEEISSCKYCPYRDICYLKPKNVVRLKEYKNLEFLGGETHDTEETRNGNLDR